MEIIFEGRLDSFEAEESLISVLRLFKDRYRIGRFREMHLSVTLVDEEGEDVELVDNETNETYRIFEVHRSGHEKPKTVGRPTLKLVIDNTR
jgi:hypothetical protein